MNELFKQFGRSYDDFLNPNENEDINTCDHCGTPCGGTYCSKACKNEDNN